MSDKIQLNSEIPQYNANIVPCKIHYTGPTNTKSYFTPSKHMDHDNHIAYFRGCKFVGKPVDVSNYDGYIINKSESLAPSEDPDDPEGYKVINTHTTVGRFNDLVVYGHDRLPTLTDPYVLMEEWQNLSRAIHSD